MLESRERIRTSSAEALHKENELQASRSMAAHYEQLSSALQQQLEQQQQWQQHQQQQQQDPNSVSLQPLHDEIQRPNNITTTYVLLSQHTHPQTALRPLLRI